MSAGEVNDQHYAPEAFMATDNGVKQALGDWVVDSGASQHMTWNRDRFGDNFSYREVGSIRTTSGSLPIRGCGHAYLSRGELKLVLKDVLSVSRLKYNLFSVSKAICAGARVTFENNLCVIEKDKVRLQVAPQNDGTMALVTSAEKWHARLGHTSVYVLKEMGLPWKLSKEC